MNAFVWLPQNSYFAITVFMCFDGHISIINNYEESKLTQNTKLLVTFTILNLLQ